MGVQTPYGVISLDDDYSADNISSENERFGITNYSELIFAADKLLENRGSRFSEKAVELGTSITLLPLSSYLSAQEAELYIFKDERLSMQKAQNIEKNSYIATAIVIILIIALIAYITEITFGGITKPPKPMSNFQRAGSGDISDPTVNNILQRWLMSNHLPTCALAHQSHYMPVAVLRVESA